MPIKPVKNATTYRQQMEILRSRGIVIDDEAFCLHTLENLNYYRFITYMTSFEKEPDVYEPTPFERIYHIYEFDRKLRALLLIVLEEIELVLRTRLSYRHAHAYGSMGYMDANNFSEAHQHEYFKHKISTIKDRNKDNSFVKHHMSVYGGNFPLWVIVELFSFGMLSTFYADMHQSDKEFIAHEVYHTGVNLLENWLVCASGLRNRCAHYMRLYDFDFSQRPAQSDNRQWASNDKIFNYIYMIKHLYHEPDAWNRDFMTSLTALIKQYEHDIDMEHIGFLKDWDRLLCN